MRNINSEDDADGNVLKSDDSVDSSIDQQNEVQVMREDYLSNPEAITHFDFLMKKFTSLLEIENIELREIMDEASNSKQRQ